MPVRFAGLSARFNALARAAGYEAFDVRVEDYAPRAGRTTFYVSPANSLCFMDGGIDRALSRAVFPGIEAKVKAAVRWLDRRSLLGRAYLPVGSALIVEPDGEPAPSPTYGARALAVAPTMLLPQDVSETQNAFHCTMAVIYSVCAVRGERLEHVDVLMTSLCCGYGKMSETESFRQIQMGLKYWADCYAPEAVHLSPTSAGMRPEPAGVSMPAECPFGDMVIREPTLRDQPRLYMNTEWFAIAPADIMNV